MIMENILLVIFSKEAPKVVVKLSKFWDAWVPKILKRGEILSKYWGISSGISLISEINKGRKEKIK